MEVNDLRSQLKEGLHEANVRAMLKTSSGLAKVAENPLPFYVLASLFGDLDSLWADQPVEAAQIALAERDLAPPLRQVIFNLQLSAPADELLVSMNRLVATFIDLRDRGALG